MFMLEVERRIEQKMSTKYNGRGGNDEEEMTAYLCVNWQAPRDRPAPQTNFPPVGRIFLSTGESMTE